MSASPSSQLASPQRVAAVLATGLIDAPPAEALDRLVRIAARLLDMPVALMSLVTDTRHVIVSQHGLGDPAAGQHSLPLDLAPCRLVVETNEPLVISDIRDDWRGAAMRSIADSGIVSYAGVPLRTHDGTVLGSFVALGPEPHAWRDDDIEWLTQLAAAATNEFALRAATRRAEGAAAQATSFATSLQHDHERFLERIAGHIPGAIFQLQLSPDGRFHVPFASGAVMDLFGVTAEQLRADPAPVGDALHPEDADALMASLRHSAETLSRWRQEYRIILPARGVKWHRGDAQPERRPDGSTLWHGFVTDISSERTEREARVDLEWQLEHAHRMEAIGTLAGGIAHDFNNILVGILGNVEMARAELPPDNDVQPLLADADSAAHRAKALVAQILDFSRGRPPQRAPTQIWPVVEEAWRLACSTLPPTVSTEVLGRDDQGAAVFADPTHVHQLVLNLCANAAAAMRGRTGRLVLRLERLSIGEAEFPTLEPLRPGPYLRLTVSDTGSGMDEQTRRRMFEPFFTMRARHEGTGLGLTMVHAIVKAHDGGVAVVSNPGLGTSVHVYLPLLVEAPPSEAPASALPAAARDRAGEGNGWRVLVVDDEESVGRTVERQLRRLGYVPTIFTRPRDALEWVRAAPDRVDAVITDLSMPELDGAELAKALRDVRADLPVILSSGLLDDESQMRARAAGASAHLTKPYTSVQLADALAGIREAAAVANAGR